MKRVPKQSGFAAGVVFTTILIGWVAYPNMSQQNSNGTAVYSGSAKIEQHNNRRSDLAMTTTTLADRTSSRWCDALNPTPFPTSFWMVKTHKSGGSTLAGVFTSVASSYGITRLIFGNSWRSYQDASMDRLHEVFDEALERSPYVATVHHRPYTEEVYRKVFPKGSLRFTAIRAPVGRFHSSFIQTYCTVEERLAGGKCSKDNIGNRWEWAKDVYTQNTHYNYIRGNTETVKEAVDQYDFVFVTERMDESLVAFMLEFGVQYEEVAYISSKNLTGQYATADTMPTKLNDFVLNKNGKDQELYEVANTVLDEKIVKLQNQCGDLFNATLSTFRHIQQVVYNECSSYRQWYHDHGFGAPYTYWRDLGVGPRCIKHVTRRELAKRTKK